MPVDLAPTGPPASTDVGRPDDRPGPCDLTDPGAWLDRCGPGLLLLARQITGDRAAGEDALQEGFVRFWRRRHEAADATAYLYACVRAAALESLRGEGRRRRREVLAGRGEAFEPDPSDGPAGEELRSAVGEALASLPAEQREVVVMKVWGGLSFPQIGEATGTGANTAASRWRYALAGLRGRLPAGFAPDLRDAGDGEVGR